MWDIAESIDLNDMPYTAGAGYVPEKGCLHGTREVVIREICDILNNPAKDAPRVCLLTGAAGSGKSAVAHSISRLYDGQKRLGSSYFFVRSDGAKRNPQNVFSTLSRDLSDHDPQFKSALWRVVKDNEALRTSVSFSEQVDQLIIAPGKNIHSIGPLIIVVDAVDESGDKRDRRQLLDVLSRQFTKRKLPANLRFLITARPERDILDALPGGPQIVHKYLGDVPHATVDEDIGKFIHHSLHQYPVIAVARDIDGPLSRLTTHVVALPYTHRRLSPLAASWIERSSQSATWTRGAFQMTTSRVSWSWLERCRRKRMTGHDGDRGWGCGWSVGARVRGRHQIRRWIR
jgi:hypothetical protein